VPIANKGKIILFENGFDTLDGRKKIRIKIVAKVNLNKPMVMGFADVNFTNTGTPAIRINVMAASIPIVNFPSC
jgi:hypothetical protein